MAAQDTDLRAHLSEWRRLAVPLLGAALTALIVFAVNWGGIVHDQAAQARELSDIQSEERGSRAEIEQQRAETAALVAEMKGLHIAVDHLAVEIEQMRGERNGLRR